MEDQKINLLPSVGNENASSPREIELFESLLQTCKYRLDEMRIPCDLLILKPNQNGSAVCFADYHNILIYIRARKAQQHFAFPTKVETLLSDSLHLERKKSQELLVYVPIVNDATVQQCCDAFVQLVSLAADKYHTFDCCGMYEQCSDAMQCLNSSDDALGCTYRKNLKAGRIFYGKNRNI